MRRENGVVRTVLAFVGSLVGAGFASGREIARFFSAYGTASWWGVAASGAALGLFCYVWLSLARATGQSSMGCICRNLLGARLGVLGGAAMAGIFGMTAGSMLAASGDLWATLVGARFYLPGMCVTAALGYAIARRGLGGLAKAAAWLLPAVVLFFGALMRTQGDTPAAKPQPMPWGVCALAAAMGGVSGALNAAQSACVLYEAGVGMQKRAALYVGAGCALLGMALVGVANGALLGATAQALQAPLPSVVMAGRWGAWGRLCACGVLWLAMFSTLATVLRGLQIQLDEWVLPRMGGRAARRWNGTLAALAVGVLVSQMGFSAIIQYGYPLLGGVCGALACVLWVRVRKNAKTGAARSQTLPLIKG